MAYITIKSEQFTSAILALQGGSLSGSADLVLYYDDTVTATFVVGTVLYTDDTFSNLYSPTSTTIGQHLEYFFSTGSPDSAIGINTNATTNIGEVISIYTDITIPSTPNNLTETHTSTSVDISWDVSSDNVAVVSYDITYGTTTVNVIATSSPTVSITGLNPGQLYAFNIVAKDQANNTSIAALLSVTTTAAPVILLSGTDPVSFELGMTYADAGATATDGNGIDITSTIVTVNPVDLTAVGTYVITYNVNADGIDAIEVTRSVIITTASLPVILLLGTDPVSLELGAVYADAGATATDNTGVDITGTIVTVNPVNTSIPDEYIITYNVSDAAGNSAVTKTRTVTITNPVPVITASNQSVSQDGTVTFDISATDSTNVTFSTSTAVSDGIISFGQLLHKTYNGGIISTQSITYSPNTGHFGEDNWKFIGTDAMNGVTAQFNIKFDIAQSPSFEMQIGSFGNDSSVMCVANRNSIAYASTLNGENNVSQLAIGSLIYSSNLNNILTNPLTTGGTDIFIPVSDTSGTRILKISTTGLITQIIECGIVTNPTYRWVNYADSTLSQCDGEFNNMKIWYDLPSGVTNILTLNELVTNNIPVFSSEYYSNLYASNVANNSTGDTLLIGTIASGIYSETDNTNNVHYKRSTTNDWVESDSNQNPPLLTWECEETLLYDVESMNSIETSTVSDPNINQYCAATKTNTNLFYRVLKNTGVISTLIELAKSNVLIYKSEIGAEIEDADDLFESNIFSDGNGFFTWENSGDNVNVKWYGYDNNNLLASGINITHSGTCSNYNKPSIPVNLIEGSGINDMNVFYGFYSSNPEIEGPDNSNNNETVFWPIYVIDGLHTNQGGDAGSHIETFITDISFGKIIKTTSFDSCLEYAVKIIAEDMDTAILLLKNTGITSQQRPVVSSGIEIGISSESVVNIYNNTDLSPCIVGDTATITSTYTFPLVSGYDTVKVGPNFNTQSNYKLDNVTKPLLRTNPKLSGNIKIVTSSDDSVYLESINASKDLASIKYKKNVINPNGNYASDVSNFFKSKGTPAALIFATKRAESDLNVLDSYDKQIEEEYQYGTTYNHSKNYTEKYRMFAPIWADDNIPSNFVIFKVKNPIGINIDAVDENNANVIQDMLENAEIVKSFDLTSTSNIGTYIRNHVQQETFPKSPITVSFDKGEMTNYNGIDIKSGEITSKGEYIHNDFVRTDKPLIEANDFITDGFKRNKMICANLLNLEFLFDDDSSVDYSVNRYFGLYVDTIDSGNGEIESISNNVIKFNKVKSLVDVDKPVTAIPSYKQMQTSPTLGYVCVNKIYYKISNPSKIGLYDPEQLEVKIDDSTGVIHSSIGISHTGRSINLTKNDERGYDFVKMSITDTPETGDKIAVVGSREEAYKFTFIKHIAGESITINLEDSTGLKQFSFNTGILFENNSLNDTKTSILNAWALLPDLNKYLDLTVDDATKSFVITESQTNLGDLNMYISSAISSIIRVDQIQSNIKIQNRTYVASYALDKGTYQGNLFSNQGSVSDITLALASAIHMDDSELDAVNSGQNIYIKTKIPGYRLLQHTVLVNKSNVVDFIRVGNHDTGNILKLREQFNGNNTVLSNWSAHYLNGGNSTSKSVYVDNTTVSEISIGDYLETRHKGKYNKVLDIVEDVRSFDSTKSKLILESKSDSESGEARVFNQDVVRIGLFSAYDVYDMNFDFYDTSNSDLKELSLETTSNIAYAPYDHAIQNIEEHLDMPGSELSANNIFNDNYNMAPINYFSNLSGILTEESVYEESTEIITSEFDRLKENQLKEFAINSRIVPNINKWVLKDSLTVRDQPYYLNTNEAFGRTNFSPDLTATGRSKDDMTHEWFYMDKKPKYLKYDNLNDTFSYVNFMEDFDLTANLFKSTNNDYFDKFMITEGFEKNLSEADTSSISTLFGEYDSGYLNTEDINNTFFKTNLKKKYTTIDGGASGSFASTIFKGLKVVLKNRKEFINKTAVDFVKNSEFNGYKFSILLKTNTDNNKNDIEFEVIQNKKFKFVIFFINLNLSDYWIDGNMNRKLLYELNHKIIYDQTIGDYVYANTAIDGALKWNTADLTGGSPYTIEGINNFDGSIPDFNNQILRGENGLYGDILMDIYPNESGNKMYKISIASIESDNVITIRNRPVNVIDDTDFLDISYLPNLLQSNIKYYYVGGGIDIYKNVLEKLSINEVADIINKDDDRITYTSIEEDGTVNNNRFTINFEDGNEIIKQATLSIEEDNNKPKSHKLSKGIIGYDLVSSKDTSYYPFLIRHNGSYTVDFKPVITFTDMYTHFKSNRIQASADNREMGLESKLYKHSLSDSYELTTAKSYYERYNRCGTTFNLGFIQDGGLHDKNWGVIKNHFYHKVNEINPSGVTKLSESSDKLPLYPAIDEIAIAKKDINVFRSSWDSGYYTRSFPGGKSESVPGTLDNTEERSYFASTLMKIKNEYSIVSFTYEIVEDYEELNYIMKNSINKSEVLLFEDDKQITADFYITDATIRLLKEDGVLARIQKHVNAENSAGDKTTLSDDADFYINKNIIEQFVVNSISLYTRSFKGAASSIVDVTDIESLSDGEYTPDNNFIYKSHRQKPMNFRLIYNKRLGYSYDIKPMIKIKS